MSLFGFDFKSDHAALSADALSEEGPRLNTKNPERSLIVRKPTEQVDHEGGRRIDADSWEHHLLLRWIEAGATGTSPAPALRSRESELTTDGITFFKETIQPLLENHCFECHG